jgi:hypothetical protein
MEAAPMTHPPSDDDRSTLDEALFAGAFEGLHACPADAPAPVVLGAVVEPIPPLP